MHQKLKIMMVDDDPHDALVIQKALKVGGHVEFLHFENGYDLFDYFGLFSYERTCEHDDAQCIILLDVNMPQKDGYEVLKLIRLNPRLGHLPVIILTSLDLEESVYLSYKSGANAHITKPSSPDEMVRFADAFSKFWLDLARKPNPSALTGGAGRH